MPRALATVVISELAPGLDWVVVLEQVSVGVGVVGPAVMTLVPITGDRRQERQKI